MNFQVRRQPIFSPPQISVQGVVQMTGVNDVVQGVVQMTGVNDVVQGVVQMTGVNGFPTCDGKYNYS